MKTSGKTPREQKRSSRDRHYLYEVAVQSPEHDIEFFDRVYKKRNGKLPRVLREDFCGTAFLSARWVRTRPDNKAIGVDRSASVLEWGRVHNIRPLAGAASRVKLVQADVRDVHEPRADVAVALNYSYFAFKERGHLLDYFKTIRACLTDGGMFVLDVFGGWETQMEVTDTTRHDGFTYLWQQEDFDPLTNWTRFRIHFEFDKGPAIKDAFTYDWRMWSIAEIRDALTEARFKRVDVYWEGIDPETGEGAGVYHPVKKAKNSPGWNALIVAS
jgi:SAM-dependent methyltransferase